MLRTLYVVATRGFLLWTEEHRRLLRWRRPTFPNSFHSLGFANHPPASLVASSRVTRSTRSECRGELRPPGLLLTTVTRPRAISWTWKFGGLTSQELGFASTPIG